MEEKTNRAGRRTDLDIAKGIGILLVIWAHASAPYSVYVRQFHMPFFFFISGMLYFPKNRTIGEYTLGKMRSLLIPFWVWNLIMYPLFFVLYYWKNWEFGVLVKEVMEIVFTLNKVPFLGATWFLPALFWISVLVHILIRAVEKIGCPDYLLIFVGIGFAYFGMFITMPYKQSRTMVCFLFYILGYLYRKYVSDKLSNQIKAIASPIGFVLFLVIASMNKVNMGNNVYRYKTLFLIGALLCTLFVLWISGLLDRYCKIRAVNHSLVYLSRNSLDLMIWHFLAFRLAIFVQIIVLRIDVFSSLTSFPIYDSSNGWWILYVLSGLFGSLLWMWILRHNPFSDKMEKMHWIRV